LGADGFKGSEDLNAVHVMHQGDRSNVDLEASKVSQVVDYARERTHDTRGEHCKGDTCVATACELLGGNCRSKEKCLSSMRKMKAKIS